MMEQRIPRRRPQGVAQRHPKRAGVARFPGDAMGVTDAAIERQHFAAHCEAVTIELGQPANRRAAGAVEYPQHFAPQHARKGMSVGD